VNFGEFDHVISCMHSLGRQSTCASTRVTISWQSRRGGTGGQVQKVLTMAGGPKTGHTV